MFLPVGGVGFFRLESDGAVLYHSGRRPAWAMPFWAGMALEATFVDFGRSTVVVICWEGVVVGATTCIDSCLIVSLVFAVPVGGDDTAGLTMPI
jgi:hypothetical protein